MTRTSDDMPKPDGGTEEPGPTPPVIPPLIDAARFPNVQNSQFRAVDGIPTFIVPASELLAVVKYLHDEGHFYLFEDITAVDWFPKEPRFQVVYHFMSLEARQGIRLKVELPGENPRVPSVTGIFLGANWYEREVFDLFGIVFDNHPDLRRIEMPTDWEGHPLRRDYPVTGPRRPNLPSNQLRLEGRNGPPQL